MSREELLQEIIEISRGIRQQEIDLGRQMEQERILNLIHRYKGKPDFTLANLIALIKGEQK